MRSLQRKCNSKIIAIDEIHVQFDMISETTVDATGEIQDCNTKSDSHEKYMVHVDGTKLKPMAIFEGAQGGCTKNSKIELSLHLCQTL